MASTYWMVLDDLAVKRLPPVISGGVLPGLYRCTLKQPDAREMQIINDTSRYPVIPRIPTRLKGRIPPKQNHQHVFEEALPEKGLGWMPISPSSWQLTGGPSENVTTAKSELGNNPENDFLQIHITDKGDFVFEGLNNSAKRTMSNSR